MASIDLVQQVGRIIHNSKLTKNLVFVLSQISTYRRICFLRTLEHHLQQKKKPRPNKYLASLNKSRCYQKRKHKKNVVISRVYSNFKKINFFFFYQNKLLSLLKYYLKEGVCLFKNSSGSAIHENG